MSSKARARRRPAKPTLARGNCGNSSVPPVEFIQVPCGQSRYHTHRGQLDVALRVDQHLLTVYLLNGGLLEYAQQMAGHESTRTTKLYDRRNDQVTLDQVERIVL